MTTMNANKPAPELYPFGYRRPEVSKSDHGWRMWNDLCDTGPDYLNAKGGMR